MILRIKESQQALIVTKTRWGSLNNLKSERTLVSQTVGCILVAIDFFLFESTNSEASQGNQNKSQTHTHPK